MSKQGIPEGFEGVLMHAPEVVVETMQNIKEQTEQFLKKWGKAYPPKTKKGRQELDKEIGLFVSSVIGTGMMLSFLFEVKGDLKSGMK